VEFSGHQPADVRASDATVAPDRDDSLNLAEREAQAPRLLKERQHSQRIGRIDAVS